MSFYIFGWEMTPAADPLPACAALRFLMLGGQPGKEKDQHLRDSPWSDQGEALNAVRASGLTGGELAAVLGGNGAKLLGWDA